MGGVKTNDNCGKSDTGEQGTKTNDSSGVDSEGHSLTKTNDGMGSNGGTDGDNDDPVDVPVGVFNDEEDG